ncbi:MAG: glycosyltransferase [Acidimicrobiales bacterium]
MSDGGGERIKVLWLTKGLGPGGAERLLLSFAQLADHDRFEIHAAYLLPWKDHLVTQLEAAGVIVHCLDGARPQDPRWIGRLRRLVSEQEIDIVHDHSPLVAAQARVALRALPRSRRPALVTTEHNLWSSHRPVTRALNRATLGLEDHVFAVSDQVRNSMSPRRQAAAEVIIHGVDVDAIAARRSERTDARTRHGLTDDDLVVVTVANLRSNKDYPTMLAAARRLVDDGVPVTFLAVGQGPLETELAGMHDDLGLGDRFRFLGYQEDPIGVLTAGDVFCLSSRFEGLPIALLEAMALGLPATVTEVGGIPHVVRDGQEGLLVPPGDPAALADAISRLTDPALRTRLAEHAGQRSHAFDIRTAVSRQEEMYELLHLRRSRRS